VSKEVIFNGTAQDVLWKSDVHRLTNDAKIYSRKDCDVVFLRKGAFIGAFDDRDEFYQLDSEKQGFFSKLFHGEHGILHAYFRKSTPRENSPIEKGSTDTSII
jgi:hypothetical protein